MNTLKLWQVDINNSYWLDDDFNIWKNDYDFYEYHIDEYTGIKDNIEYWEQELAEDHNLEELKGDEIIKRIVEDMQESLDYYREKYQ